MAELEFMSDDDLAWQDSQFIEEMIQQRYVVHAGNSRSSDDNDGNRDNANDDVTNTSQEPSQSPPAANDPAEENQDGKKKSKGKRKKKKSKPKPSKDEDNSDPNASPTPKTKAKTKPKKKKKKQATASSSATDDAKSKSHNQSSRPSSEDHESSITAFDSANDTDRYSNADSKVSDFASKADSVMSEKKGKSKNGSATSPGSFHERAARRQAQRNAKDTTPAEKLQNLGVADLLLVPGPDETSPDQRLAEFHESLNQNQMSFDQNSAQEIGAIRIAGTRGSGDDDELSLVGSTTDLLRLTTMHASSHHNARSTSNHDAASNPAAPAATSTTAVVAPSLSNARPISDEELHAEIRNDILTGVTHAMPVAAVSVARQETSRDPQRDQEAAEDGSDDEKEEDQSSDDMRATPSKGRLMILVALVLTCCIIVVTVVVVFVLLRDKDGNSGGSNDSSGTRGDILDNRNPPTIVPTEAPSRRVALDLEPHHLELLEWLDAFVVNADSLSDTSSPQYRAFEWLAETDVESSWDVPLIEDGTAHKAAFTLIERYTLATLYFSTDGDNWDDRTKWLTAADVCEWGQVSPTPKIICDNKRITRLLLIDNNLSGTIPVELAMLKDIEELNLSDNPITMPGGRNRPSIPTELGKLTSLTALHLSNLNLGGTLPTALGALSRLQDLWIDATGVGGAVPTQFGKMLLLEEGMFSSNELSGQLPSELGKITTIQRLDLSNNSFVGTIPRDYVRVWPFPLSLLNLVGNQLDFDAIENTFCTSVIDTEVASRFEASCSVTSCSCCTQCF